MTQQTSGQDDVGYSRSVLALIKDWKEIVVIVGGALTAALTTFGLKAEGTAQVIGYSLTLLLLAAGGCVYYRIRRRQAIKSQREKLRAAFEDRKNERTAFRGLYPYQEADVLPGEQRQREAQMIFTQLTAPDFSFGVVCGDSGCGKTSLLRCAVQGLLKKAGKTEGFHVFYVSNPRELIARAGHTDDDVDPAMNLARQLFALKQAVAERAADAPVIVIIDQFEEFFIEYRAEQRAALGACLNELIKSTPPTRILCALRRDYLVDIRDLSPQLPDPLSVKTLFSIKNFTAKLAADVITECASLDNLAIEEGLADLLAADLVNGGQVRPPELQIVCTALIGNPTIAEYRLRGGAPGILSHYIESAVAICSNPKLGGQVLRALCDFAARTKRKPQNASQLLDAIDTTGLPKEQADQLLHDILGQFETARIVLFDNRGTEVLYSLVHDYLVGVVAIATSDASTRTEEANQLLKYYMSERGNDPKLKIPFRRYRFIKKHADKGQLADTRVRHLLNASRNSAILSIVALLLLILASTAVLLTALNTHRSWQLLEIGRHYSENKSGTTILKPLPNGERLFTGLYASSAYARLWDTKTGKLLDTEMGPDLSGDITGDFLLAQPVANSPGFVLHVPTLKKYPLPAGESTYHGPGPQFQFGAAGNVLMKSEYANNDTQFSNLTLRVWSVFEQRELGAVHGLNGVQQITELNRDATRLITLSVYKKDPLLLWDVQSGSRVAELRDNKDATVVNDIAISEETHRVATLQKSPTGETTVLLWDLQTGRLILKREVPINQYQQERNLRLEIGGHPLPPINIRFSPNGDFVVLSNPTPQRVPLAVLNTSDLLHAQQCPTKGLLWDSEEENLAWKERDTDTMVWDITSNPPNTIKGLKLRAHDELNTTPNEISLPAYYANLSVYRSVNRVVSSNAEEIELYDLSSGKKIGNLNTQGRWRNYQATLDGHALSVLMEGGSIRLFNLESGQILGDLSDAGDDSFEAYYDPACQRIHVWTQKARVVRYTKGIELFGRWFWPSIKCGD